MAERVESHGQRSSQRRIRSRWQRERRKTRVVLLGGLVAILLILAIPAYGYYDTFIAPPREWIVKVNDKTYTQGDLVQLLRMYQRSAVQGGDFNLGTLPFQLINTLTENELVRQGAPREGITVTTAEIDAEVRQRFLGDTTDTTAPADQLDRDFQEQFREYLNLIKRSEQQYRELVEYDLYREALREHLGQRVDRVQPQVHLYSVEIPPVDAPLELAEEIRTEYIRGTPFEELVKRADLAQPAEAVRKGGEVGWFPRGVFPEIDTLIFDELDVGKLSDPILSFDAQQGLTTYTIYLVQEQADAREIEEDQLEILKTRALQAWITEERQNNNVDTRFSSDRYEWVITQLRRSDR